MKNSGIYFDHSATTPVDKEVLEAMKPCFDRMYGNPSSIHSFGQQAAGQVDAARRTLAEAFNCQSEEVVFTSGSTESNNIAIRGLVEGLEKKVKAKPHVITTMVEHDAVIEPCRDLARSKLAEVTYLEVDKSGRVSAEAVAKAIRPETVLVSVMAANSEVGVYQPIKEIGKLVKKENQKRIKEWEKTRPAERGDKPVALHFHSDATQAVNFKKMDMNELHLDLMSVSAHKIYGPKGVGALMARGRLPLKPLVRGGHHEKNIRSGTLNVPGIVGLGKAVEIAERDRDDNNKFISELRNYLVEQINAKVDNVVLNTDLEYATPSHAHFSFLRAEGEAILMALDMEAGIAVSTGSACASNTLKASSVLLAMGVKKEDTHGAIRFTLGKHNTKAEIDKLMKHLPGIVEKFRQMAPEY